MKPRLTLRQHEDASRRRFVVRSIQHAAVGLLVAFIGFLVLWEIQGMSKKLDVIQTQLVSTQAK